jgi:hypothetical protein
MRRRGAAADGSRQVASLLLANSRVQQIASRVRLAASTALKAAVRCSFSSVALRLVLPREAVGKITPGSGASGSRGTQLSQELHLPRSVGRRPQTGAIPASLSHGCAVEIFAAIYPSASRECGASRRPPRRARSGRGTTARIGAGLTPPSPSEGRSEATVCRGASSSSIARTSTPAARRPLRGRRSRVGQIGQPGQAGVSPRLGGPAGPRPWQ